MSDIAAGFTSSSEVREFLSCHPLIAELLWTRGFRATKDLERLLTPELSNLPSPFTIIDMKKAAERAVRAVLECEKITVYGDYDVDGTCGASILIEFFRSVGVEVDCYQPDRFKEGYGVHVTAVERLIDAGTQLLITVDCGITAVEPARVAKERGIDMIILDHHQLGAKLPDAFAVANPQRPEDESGMRNVCGAGLAFFFAVGLRTLLREAGFFAEGSGRSEPNLVKLLDLVAVATVADVVDIRGVNRILVSHGLKQLSKNPRPGFKALLETAEVKGRITPVHCGFVLGPRINAAGRLKSAKHAFDLLTCTDIDEARVMAQELDALNKERRKTQDGVHDAARLQALAQLQDPMLQALAAEIPAAPFGPWPRVLVLAPPAGEHWHEGVVGIVATRIVEEFGRPAFVLSETEGEKLKGSVRSINGIDILRAISTPSVAENLLNFGGHAHAGGVSLKREKYDSFVRALNEHLAITTDSTHYKKEARFDLWAKVADFNEKLLVELENLGPFGPGFPEPIFRVEVQKLLGTNLMKDKHLKLMLGPEGYSPISRVDAVWFNAVTADRTAETLLSIAKGSSLWVSPQWNEWQGRKTLQLKVSHAELVGTAQT